MVPPFQVSDFQRAQLQLDRANEADHARRLLVDIQVGDQVFEDMPQVRARWARVVAEGKRKDCGVGWYFGGLLVGVSPFAPACCCCHLCWVAHDVYDTVLVNASPQEMRSRLYYVLVARDDLGQALKVRTGMQA